MEKHSVSRLSYLFAHLHLLSSDLFSSDSSHLCFSTVHIVGSFTSKLPSINICGFVRGTHELISPAAGTTNKLGISCSDFCLTQTHILGAAERNNSDCSAPLGFSACRSCRRKISGSFAFSQSRSASNHPILLALNCALGLQLIGLRCFIPKKW